MIKDNFCSYELSMALKDKGFDEECFGSWEINGTKHTLMSLDIFRDEVKFKYLEAPLYQQAISFLREKHIIHITFKHHPESQTYGFTISGAYQIGDKGELVNERLSHYTFEEAQSAAILQAIKLIKV